MADNKNTQTTDNVVNEESKPKFPTEIVDLPSKGHFYPEDNASKFTKAQCANMCRTRNMPFMSHGRDSKNTSLKCDKDDCLGRCYCHKDCDQKEDNTAYTTYSINKPTEGFDNIIDFFNPCDKHRETYLFLLLLVILALIMLNKDKVMKYVKKFKKMIC